MNARFSNAARTVCWLVLAASAAACTPRQAPLPQSPRAAVIRPPADTTGLPVAATAAVPGLTRVTEEPRVPLEVAEGEATYYADRFNGRRTASGIVFSNDAAYAAHRTWPFGTVVRVINEQSGRSVILTVVDRGPHGSARTIIDVSRSAAEELGFIVQGRIPVRVEVLEWGDGG